jgi:hypothetical protein
MIDTVAMVTAAKACGCQAVAAQIEAKALSPEGVARLFRLSARSDRVAAIVILAGSIARSAADPGQWRDKGKRELAISLIERFQFAECDRLALRLVRRHWAEITKAPAPEPAPTRESSLLAAAAFMHRCEKNGRASDGASRGPCERCWIL